jgi:hypothetical protein
MASIAHWNGVLKGRVLAGNQESLSKHWNVEHACQAHGHRWRERLWSPLQTVWTFLLQALHVDSSCREAVAMALGQRLAAGQPVPQSDDPSAYCQARKRLPLAVLREGLRSLGQQLQAQAGKRHTWCGHRVWLVDGTTCSMPDTPALQAAFGQPDAQAPGCGFPVARIVGLFCWASGAVLEAAIGPYRQSELALWRSLRHLLKAGEVVVADRFYCSFADLAGLIERSCHGLFRLHQRRRADFRYGQRLGQNDRLVVWRRPTYQHRPRGMGRWDWQRLPEQLTVRLLRFCTDIPGFRSRCIDVATDLLDPVAYPAEMIAALYRDRWLIELRFRDIKTTLAMDVLRGRSPDVVRKEIHMKLLAYNLIRGLMWQAAREHGQNLHRLSFAGTMDRLNALGPYLWFFAGTAKAQLLYAWLLRCMAADLLPYRPNRIEPRALKRRPKEYDRLNRPREQMRQALLGN